MRSFILICCLLAAVQCVHAQIGQRFGNMGGGGGASMQKDTGKHTHEPDTITISYRRLGEPTDYRLDSSLADFTDSYLRVPATYMFLGNTGAPARNLLFTPFMKPGFDAGYHTFDVYGFNHENARIYTTTKPYSELRYLVGSQQEQHIGVLHTQNRTDRFNFGFEYNKKYAPGFFRSQATNHDIYRVTGRFNSKNKRYNAYLSYFYNKFNNGENGGIRGGDSILDNPTYSQRKTVDVNLGNYSATSSGLFTTTLPVKTTNKQSGFMFVQQYDWGKGDTIHVNDTTDYYKFDPFFRVQYTFKVDNDGLEYLDGQPDTFFYANKYNWGFNGDTIRARHEWRNISNDISLIQFPIRGNQGHFISAGARYESIRGTFLDANISFSNLVLHGEYRNKTRNQKWDLQAKGEFYLTGQNAGDYNITGMLSRYLNETLGNVHLLFSNTNREASYIYKYFSSTYDSWYNNSLGKENTTLLQFSADNRKLKYNLAVNYYLMENYTYFSNYYTSAQAPALFNLLQVVLNKHFKYKKYNWYAEFAFQQVHGDGRINVPAFWTRHRLAYETKLFNNLNLMTGIEAKYNTSYYADDYSPVIGQFVYQTTQRIKYYAPDLAAFVHFRIKSLSAFIRGENLNTFFATNNFAGPAYPYNNFTFRLGLRWWFIN
ncbi:putative porin [Chitinophaga agri]|uniref:Putative porin n=1 Tax=Chitinophaga agri TaxID=2703787 RepID=A0A6B9ZD73_9BACT|nr:putative porin [Chitinophaga agri]QHS60382.1 putative porin [Chitinophaga agri]